MGKHMLSAMCEYGNKMFNDNDFSIPENIYIYTRKSDNRVMAVYKQPDGKMTSKSYPRMLMEAKLHRKLYPWEDVHHIDGNTLNNDLGNLAVVLHGPHQREHSTKYHYEDMIVKCDVCGCEFVWTPDQQRRYHRDVKAGRKRLKTCSKSCAGYAARMNQLGNDNIKK